MGKNEIGDIRYIGKHVVYMLLIFIVLFSIQYSYWYFFFLIALIPIRTYYKAKQYIYDANISINRGKSEYAILDENYYDYMRYISFRKFLNAFKTIIKGKKKIVIKREKTQSQYEQLLEDILVEFYDISLFKNVINITFFTEDKEMQHPIKLSYIINNECNIYTDLYTRYGKLMHVADDIFILLKNKIDKRKYFLVTGVEHDYIAIETPNWIRTTLTIEVLK